MLKCLYLLILLACLADVGFTKSWSLQERELRYFEDHFNKTLECIKKKLSVGIPNLGIPPFNPWTREGPVDLQLDNKYIWTNLKMNRMLLEGLVSFDTVSITLSPLMKLDIKFHFEKIRASASYVGDFNLLGLLLFYGNGDINMEFRNIKLDTSTQFQIIPPLIGDFYSIISMGETEIKITGINNDEGLSEYFSKLASQAASLLINLFKKDIAAAISPLVKEGLNRFIGDYSFLEFLAIITKFQCN